MASACARGLLVALTTYAAHVWRGQAWGGTSRKAASSSTQRDSSEAVRTNARRYLDASEDQVVRRCSHSRTVSAIVAGNCCRTVRVGDKQRARRWRETVRSNLKPGERTKASTRVLPVPDSTTRTSLPLRCYPCPQSPRSAALCPAHRRHQAHTADVRGDTASNSRKPAHAMWMPFSSSPAQSLWLAGRSTAYHTRWRAACSSCVAKGWWLCDTSAPSDPMSLWGDSKNYVMARVWCMRAPALSQRPESNKLQTDSFVTSNSPLHLRTCRPRLDP